MIEISYLYVALVLIGSLLALLAIWSRRKFTMRLMATFAFMLLAGTALFSLIDLLSRPKPTSYEFANESVEEATVLAVTVDEGHAIYVWFRFPHSREPRAYTYPWDLEMATELKDAIKQANEDRTHLRMRKPFDPSNEVRKAPRFYSLPPERLPRKPEEDPFEYKHPSITA